MQASSLYRPPTRRTTAVVATAAMATHCPPRSSTVKVSRSAGSRCAPFAAGRTHTFHLKVVSPVRWKQAGGTRQLPLIIVRAVPYRLRKRGPLSYRRPAYLICTTDPSGLSVAPGDRSQFPRPEDFARSRSAAGPDRTRCPHYRQLRRVYLRSAAACTPPLPPGTQPAAASSMAATQSQTPHHQDHHSTGHCLVSH
jgi:hypothetical protein